MFTKMFVLYVAESTDPGAADPNLYTYSELNDEGALFDDSYLAEGGDAAAGAEAATDQNSYESSYAGDETAADPNSYESSYAGAEEGAGELAYGDGTQNDEGYYNENAEQVEDAYYDETTNDESSYYVDDEELMEGAFAEVVAGYGDATGETGEGWDATASGT